MASRQNNKFVDIFKDTFHFPAFVGLPDQNELDEDYYQPDPWYGGVYTQACPWFFLAEITHQPSDLPPIRLGVLTRDRAGQEHVPIFFYPETGSLCYKTLKRGHTICVRLAEQHQFLDLNVGLRIEDLDTVSVFPVMLDELFSLSHTYAERKDSQCWSCSKEASCSKSLKKCAACKTVYYCDSACQTKDWKQRHRKWCKAMPKFLFLEKADFSKYDKKYWA